MIREVCKVVQVFVFAATLTSELRVRLAHRETGLSPHVNYFTDRSKVVLLLWIINVVSVIFCYASVRVCLLMPCGHLLGTS